MGKDEIKHPLKSDKKNQIIYYLDQRKELLVIYHQQNLLLNQLGVELEDHLLVHLIN